MLLLLIKKLKNRFLTVTIKFLILSMTSTVKSCNVSGDSPQRSPGGQTRGTIYVRPSCITEVKKKSPKARTSPKGKKTSTTYILTNSREDRKLESACGSLEDAIEAAQKEKLTKMVRCPLDSKYMVPEGDIKSLNWHLKNHFSETYQQLLLEAGAKNWLKNIFVYPDCYSIKPRFISKKQFPDKSFEDRDELMQALKKRDGKPTFRNRLEETCNYEKKCTKFLNGSCSKNHYGAAPGEKGFCKHEQGQTSRCYNSQCRYDHFEGQRIYALTGRLRYLKKQLKKLDEDSSSSKDSEAPVASPIEDANQYDHLTDEDSDEDEGSVKESEGSVKGAEGSGEGAEGSDEGAEGSDEGAEGSDEGAEGSDYTHQTSSRRKQLESQIKKVEMQIEREEKTSKKEDKPSIQKKEKTSIQKKEKTSIRKKEKTSKDEGYPSLPGASGRPQVETDWQKNIAMTQERKDQEELSQLKKKLADRDAEMKEMKDTFAKMQGQINILIGQKAADATAKQLYDGDVQMVSSLNSDDSKKSAGQTDDDKYDSEVEDLFGDGASVLEGMASISRD